MELSPNLKARSIKNFFLKDFTCPVHAMSRICGLCIKSNCPQQTILYCDKCRKELTPNSHYLTHKQFSADINMFLHDCLGKLPVKVNSEYSESSEIMKELKNFLAQIDKELASYQGHIETEACKIDEDFKVMIAKVDALKNLMVDTKNSILSKLKEDLAVINKDLKELKRYTEDGSPLLVRRETSVSSMLLRRILSLNDPETQLRHLEKVCRDLVGELSSLTKEFDIAWIEKTDEEGGLIKTHHMNSLEMMKKLNNSMVAVRNRLNHPPKYKTYHNSSQILNNFMHNLDQNFKTAKEFAEILLISQNQSEMLFKGKSSLTYEIGPNNLGVCKRFDNLPKALTLCSTINTSHKKGINCIAMFGNDKFATGANDFVIRIWDLLTFKFIKGFKCERIPYSLLTLEDEYGCPVLISGHAEGYLIVVTENLEIKHVFKEQDSLISTIVSLKDGRTVIAGSYDSTIVFYDIKNCVAIRKITDHAESLNCLDVSSNQKKLASGSDDTSIKIWNIGYSKANFFESIIVSKSIDNGHSVKTIRFLMNHPNILLSNCYNIIKMWDCDMGVCIKKLCKHDHYIYKIATLEIKDLKARSRLKRKTMSMSFRDFNELKDFKDKEETTLINNNNNTTNNTNVNANGPPSEEHSPEINSQTQADLMDLLKLKELYILTFGQDHKIKLWSVMQESRVSEVNDELKEFSMEDPFGNTLLLINEKDNMVHFLSTSDKETFINIWKISE